MKKSKAMLIVPIIIIASLIIWFIGKEVKTNTQETLDISKISPEEAAQEIKPYIKDMEVEEIKEILNQELTEKQQDTSLAAPTIFR